MKILHVCLSNFYIDNYGYQENILPKMHKLQGHEVAILASTETFIENSKLGYVEPSSYITEYGVPITRIPYSKKLPHGVAKKIRIYNGVKKTLYSFKPDILFIHGGQFVSIMEIVNYVKKHPHVKIYIDNHADYINSGTNWVSRKLLHGIIYKWAMNIVEPYTSKFYGVLPVRVDFLKEVYNTPSNKTELLVLGIDDSNIDFANKCNIRNEIRQSLQISDNDFVIITGGKIDRRKNIHLLLQAVSEIDIKNIKLITFGTPNEEMRHEFEKLSSNDNIINLGWITPEQANNYFFAADIACFPGTHSVLWEQAVGLGLPAIFKRWEGIDHIDLDGNCIMLDDVNVETVKKSILGIYNNKRLFVSMQESAKEGIKIFSYYDIAKRAIEE
jgi:1,2-diacylglycerol 3-alpha-glucosyltransferase